MIREIGTKTRMNEMHKKLKPNVDAVTGAAPKIPKTLKIPKTRRKK